MKVRRRRDGGDISMFPFLAVLICTMGALILLLIIISHQASVQAKREAVEVHEQRKVELAEQREDATWRREILEKSLEQTRKKLADTRHKLGYVESDTTRLRKDVTELAKMLKKLKSQHATSGNPVEFQQKLASLHTKIVSARRRLSEALRKATSNKGKYQSYAVVPYHGPHETRRHPIYVECRSDGVILQPEGIRLTESDFEGFFGPDNPLAAALRAKADYLHQKYQFSEELGRPYPLLLVRQSGIESYCAAMDAMKSWDSEFGYELIEDDMKVDFNEPNPRLRQLVLQEIKHARNKRQAMAKALPRLYSDPTLARSGGGNGGRRYYTVSSGKGGIVPYNGDTEDFEPSRPRRPVISGRRPSSPSQLGSRNGNGTGTMADSYPAVAGKNTPADLAGSSPYPPTPSYGSAPYSAGSNGTSGNRFGDGNSQQPPHQLASSGGSGTTETPWNGTSRNGTPRNRTFGNGALSQGGEKANFGMHGVPDEPKLLSPPGTGTTGQYAQEYSPNPGGRNNQYGNSPSSWTQGNNASQGANPMQGSNAMQNAAASPSSASMQNPALRQSGSFAQGSPYGTSQNAAGTTQGSAANQKQLPEAPMPEMFLQGARDSSEGGSSSSSCPFAMNSPNSPMAGQTQQAPLGIGNYQPNSGSPNASTQPSEPRDPDPFAPAHRSSSRRPKSIAEDRGKDWCLPKEAAYRVALSRPVSIDCYADRLVFRPKRGGLGTTTIKLQGQTQDSVNEFVSAVWDRVELWGMAGQGMYWKPVLAVHVQSGGEARFADLKTLFQNSGFTIEQKKQQTMRHTEYSQSVNQEASHAPSANPVRKRTY